MKKILLALTLLAGFVSQAYGSELVHIRNASDWTTFRDKVKAANGKYDVNAILDADVNAGTIMVGWETQNYYRGTFDGNGHTINVNISGSNLANIALFRYGRNFTINNLNVKGTITAGDGLAGLVGSAEGVNGANKIPCCAVENGMFVS